MCLGIGRSARGETVEDPEVKIAKKRGLGHVEGYGDRESVEESQQEVRKDSVVIERRVRRSRDEEEDRKR